MGKSRVNATDRVKKWSIRLFTGSVCRWIMENMQLIQLVVDLVSNFFT